MEEINENIEENFGDEDFEDIDELESGIEFDKTQT